MPVRVCHVITGLEMGGAETMLAKLCETLPPERVQSTVVALRSKGPLAMRIRGAGVRVAELGLRPGAVPGLGDARRLRRAVSETNAQVVQAWMYHANLGAIVIRPGVPVIWNVRQTLYDIKRERHLTRAVIRCSALLSAFPSAILYNSFVAARQHEAIGFDGSKSRVIPNGFDVTRFAPSATSRREVRLELGLPADAVLIGLVARAHPMKDHAMFLDAACRVAHAEKSVHFVLVGEGTERHAVLEANCPELIGRIHALGPREDIPRLTAALDIACSSSAWGEGFPNILGEALSSGVPCVATNVGDSAQIVGDSGEMVEPGNAKGFADGILRLIRDRDRRVRLGTAGRQRIIDHYSLHSVAARYTEVYEEVSARSPRAP